MFSTISTTSSNPRSSAAAPARPVRSRPVRQTVDEAYELRLLAEVARWDDQAAFEELYGHHRAAVVRAARSICRDADTAEDIAQQTFAALWVRAERLLAKSVRLRPWLTTVARNAAIDVMRTERPAATIDDAIACASTDVLPDAAAAASDDHARLHAALAELSPSQRAAVECVYFRDMTYAAAAAVLGVPAGTLKSRVRLGIAHLRRALEPAV